MDRFEISQKLVELRGSKTRDEVAEANGISKRALEAYETGYRVPRDEVKLQLAEYYDVSVGFLFFGE